MFGFDLTPEQEQLRDAARRFAREEMIPVAARHDEEQLFPTEVARKAWELGLMNFEVPSAYGGPDLGVLDSCIVLEELNYACAGITNVVAANGLAAIPADPRRYRRAEAALPRTARDRLLVRGILHHRAGRRVRRRRDVDDVSPGRRRVRPERYQALHLERQRRRLVRGLRHLRSEGAPRGHHRLRLPVRSPWHQEARG